MWRLQGAKEEDALLFQKMANEGHYRKTGGTRQGIYVCTANGTLLSSVNSLDPNIVLETVNLGLDKWNKLTMHSRYLPIGFNPVTSHRWEDSFPENGLILQGAKADLLSDPPEFDNRGDRWNMDHIWFNKEEMNLWLPKEKRLGEIYQCPKIIQDRLFRFHLVDNVRGQTLPFAPEEIKESKLNVKIIGIDEQIINIEITGSSEAIAKGPWLLGENDWTPPHDLDHKIKTNLLGKASYDIKKESFLKFEILAIGHWFGKTENNGRKFGPDSGRIGILYNIADKSQSSRIAPAFVDLYNAEWIKKPN